MFHPSMKIKNLFIIVTGDSFYNRLTNDRLGKREKTDIRSVAGGSRMEKVQKTTSDFVISYASKDVTKCFINISMGTNDVRNCQNGIGNLKTPLFSFIKSAKAILFGNVIFMQYIPS